MQIQYKTSNSFYHILYNENRTEKAQLDVSGEVPLITFPVLKHLPFLTHGFSTRFGGVSAGEFSTLNLSFQRGDREEDVIENYNRICRTLGVKTEQLVFSDQVHDTKVVKVTKSDCQGTHLVQRKLMGIDGLVTDEPGVVLCTSYADCVPLFFVDKKKKAIGLSHSGWKGTVGKIGRKTVEEMEKQFGSEKEDIICVIGPSICSDCYEVSEDVAVQFQNSFQKNQSDKIIYPKGNGKYQLDLWLANWFVLSEAGISPENIWISSICTCCNKELLFSHRASQGKRGNLCGFLSIQ
ncbi:peptidoglycan editing factor PgeF [Anaeromicropila populeti]|uniref:Purine nucleoside phosphorylase n=1 Tax=Anaeromicropila populeti TaxID=37658 RepID=A0A1I6L797_9FIRM|nr:peptidoglycan editing factor PgeF [Anaeromicropila populeti]SFR99339.1 conserved hypothetical protein [Anaeromicropila populeti]